MDDFNANTLSIGRDEWIARLQNVMTPSVIQGLREIFTNAFATCKEQHELQSYLSTFQTLLQLIPKWNPHIIETEKKRILEVSGCAYLEDLVTCVHVIQLKALTSIRVSNKQKKIDLSIPSLNAFIHNVYIHAARKIYSNVYLYDAYAKSIDVQKHNREIELIVNECVLQAVRDGIPTEYIIRAYLDEGIEHEELIKIENIEEVVAPPPPSVAATATGPFSVTPAVTPAVTTTAAAPFSAAPATAPATAPASVPSVFPADSSNIQIVKMDDTSSSSFNPVVTVPAAAPAPAAPLPVPPVATIAAPIPVAAAAAAPPPPTVSTDLFVSTASAPVVGLSFTELD
jgi:hypothetical protein